MKTLLMCLGLLIAGIALSFLMVIRVLEPSFLLSFLAYGASLVGLTLGVVVALQHAGYRERREDLRDGPG